MSRPQTPVEAYQRPDSTMLAHRPTTGSRPNSYIATGQSGATDFADAHHQGGPSMTSPISQSGGYAGTDVGSTADGHDLQRSVSQMSGSMSQSQTLLPSRGGTLKKKASLKKSGSLKRSSSRRSSRAGSVRSLNLGDKEKYADNEQRLSAFYTPIPTGANPTEVLSNRFQAWRKVLKDLITYFREIQKSYDTRSKSLVSASNVMSNTLIPTSFLTNGGLGDAIHILRDFHKTAINESNKAKDLENEVIVQLTGLRSDLQQKIKEIKTLSGDFKNSVDKETEITKKAVRHLQESLGLVDTDPASTSGKGDPFIVKMAVDRQLERQIEEENYLHRAYLNLESSGRELEAIVVGEIQKAYNAYANIIRREADESFETVEKLREGPVAMPKDKEWDSFVHTTDEMVDPRIPLRQFGHITYPGKDHPAALEVKSGMLERKSKYLKNYTPGWYVLSPTHLHEFKSADRISSQQPIMSLYLPEQKLGSHSEPGSSSHKFMLKGRQTGSMHRGHSWIFRAESHETMMAWFMDIKELTEKRGEERNAFVRRSHARSVSGSSFAPSIGGSSDEALKEDEADAVPYSDEKSVRTPMGEGAPSASGMGADGSQEWRSASQARQRPQPGGRFPSELNVDRGLQAPLSPSSGESSPRVVHAHPNPIDQQTGYGTLMAGDVQQHQQQPQVPDRAVSQSDHDALAGASSLPGSGVPFTTQPPQQQDQYTSDARHDHQLYSNQQRIAQQQATQPDYFPRQQRHDSSYGDWMASAGAGATIGAGVVALAAHHQHKQQVPQELEDPSSQIATSSLTHEPAPIALASQTTTSADSSAHPATDAASQSTGMTSLATGVDDAGFGKQPISAGAVDAGTGLPAGNSNATTMGMENVRPAPPVHAQSVSTISDLHIPGEYPKQAQNSTTGI